MSDDNRKTFLIVDAWESGDKSDLHRCVISSVWCRNNRKFCYWPNNVNLDKLSLYKLLRKHTVPDEDKWEMYEINIKQSYGMPNTLSLLFSLIFNNILKL